MTHHWMQGQRLQYRVSRDVEYARDLGDGLSKVVFPDSTVHVVRTDDLHLPGDTTPALAAYDDGEDTGRRLGLLRASELIDAMRHDVHVDLDTPRDVLRALQDLVLKEVAA